MNSINHYLKSKRYLMSCISYLPYDQHKEYEFLSFLNVKGQRILNLKVTSVEKCFSLFF